MKSKLKKVYVLQVDDKWENYILLGLGCFDTREKAQLACDVENAVSCMSYKVVALDVN